MITPITSRIRRDLGYMEPYKNFKDCDKNPNDYPILLDEGEPPLGIYENKRVAK